MTTALVAVTIAAWLLATLIGQQETIAVLAGFIPARASGALDVAGALPVAFTPLSATLVHGGVLHVVFNMLMLGFCGRMVEVALGSPGMVALYVLGAYAAAAAQYLAGPLAAVPVIGASGAISAVVGAYAILYGQRRQLPAGWPSGLVNVLWLAAAWIGLQLLVGIATSGSGMTVALAEHIGGFLAGLALARPLLLFRYRRA